jgi:hypothetical protein
MFGDFFFVHKVETSKSARRVCSGLIGRTLQVSVLGLQFQQFFDLLQKEKARRSNLGSCTDETFNFLPEFELFEF